MIVYHVLEKTFFFQLYGGISDQTVSYFIAQCADSHSVCFPSPPRQALFGDHVKKPQSLEDTDLSRLCTATSLMQIDDNVMRCAHSPGRGARRRQRASTAQNQGFPLHTLLLRVLFLFFFLMPTV